MPGGELRRYRVPLTGSQSIEKDVLYGNGILMPRTAENAIQSEYQYVYGLANQRFVSDSTPNQLLKVNVKNSKVQTYDSSHDYFGEPVFVTHPEGTAEDDGIVLSVALDTDADHSWLLILDANSFQERARAAIPHPVPFDFHGRFFEGVR